MIKLIEELTKTQERANELLEELLHTVRFSNRVLMMVNGVNIVTVLVIIWIMA